MYYQQRLWRGLFWFALAGLLLACDSNKVQESDYVRQQNYFLQAVELIESAGRLLQKTNLSDQDIKQAMQRLDEGLKTANQVRQDFLKQADARLPRLFPELLVKGVESYRLGVEGADRSQQLEGLRLIRQWSQFWRSEGSQILDRLLQQQP